MRSALARTTLMVVALVVAACGSSPATPAATPSSPQPAPSATPAATQPAASPTATLAPTPFGSINPRANPDAAGTVWLCRPGLDNNPCAGSLATTSIDSKRKATVQQAEVATDPPIDCFYVYPTVSREPTVNADLRIGAEERAVAIAQAALFSQVCNVYAPIYPQLTLHALNSGGINLSTIEIAYSGLRSTFADYLANYNHGRGIVFIGHSQGALMLIGMLHFDIDSNPALRKQVVSALLMGGNVTVPAGKKVGGVFANIPACESAVQVGCVVAYSSFDKTPPADADFGRTTGALQMLNLTGSGPQEILCVNPASPAGGSAALLPYFPTVSVAKLAGAPVPTPKTPYVSYPGALTAQCKNEGGASWLQITRSGPKGVTPAIAGSEGPGWGLHDLDVSLALGNLVGLVRSESAAYKP